MRKSPQEVAATFGVAANLPLFASFNIAPTQPVAIVRQRAGIGRELALARWGLVPSWSKDGTVSAQMINARSETAAIKPAFRASFKRRRCLIPADGFYEWKPLEDGKQPYFIGMPGNRLFALAGLWDSWQGGTGAELETCAILTTEANDLMRPIHERMPVILQASDYERWLDTSIEDPAAVEPLLQPYGGGDLIAYPVSTFVNNARNQGEKCVAPL